MNLGYFKMNIGLILLNKLFYCTRIRDQNRKWCQNNNFNNDLLYTKHECI